MTNYLHGMPIIDDDTDNDVLYPRGCGRGLEPRDHDRFPESMFAPPDDMELIPESEWEARIQEQDERQSSLEHIYRRADNGQLPPNLDQNGSPLCWAHSTTHAVQVSRAVANLPFVHLAPYEVAYNALGGGGMSGGWCGASAKEIATNGVCRQDLWKQGEWRESLNTAEMREDADDRRIVEEWRDLSLPVYGQKMTWNQVVTALLNNQPCACDFNHWRHSVCGVRIVQIEPGSLGLLILNSWGRSYGKDGFSVMRGWKKVPDGAIAIRSTTASA